MRLPIKTLLSLSVAFFLVMNNAKRATAQLNIFQTEEQAQLHCPTDVVVWLDFTKRRYYFRGQRLYGKGKTGVYTCREEARISLNRRSLLGWR
jgi:hypothetical protein